MQILKVGDNWNLINIVKYMVHSCEINPKVIKFKIYIFSDTRIHLDRETDQDDLPQTNREEGLQKTASVSPNKKHLLLIWTSDAEWCLLNRQFPPLDGITMTTTTNRWQDSGDRLAMTNNQNVPNTYKKHI